MAGLADLVNLTQRQVTEQSVALIDAMPVPPIGCGFKATGKDLASGIGGF